MGLRESPFYFGNFEGKIVQEGLNKILWGAQSREIFTRNKKLKE
jgi:hypothetical protein